MKEATVVNLIEYRRKKARQEVRPVEIAKALPDARELWMLFDQDEDLYAWNEGELEAGNQGRK